MKVLVGLGNPGKKYEGTRHNIGFELLAEVARRHGASRPKSKFEAEISEATVGSERLLLVAPQTFMNLSGKCVRLAADFYQLSADDLLVACDDINLRLGRLRIRKFGSAGGQKGLANILQHMGTEAVPRLRIGIDPPPEGRDAASYVLDRFAKIERSAIDEAVRLGAQAVEVWLESGLDAAMNRFNAEKTGEPDEPDA
ncbi:MAG: aminoacyl-tRNA hydrolase [Planctomycetaceae bacterium]|nr:aminoacyl-tRNA hydrolase [Planctomycetaceae bacterium]